MATERKQSKKSPAKYIPVRPMPAIRTGKKGRRAAYTVFCGYCKEPHGNVATTADFPETCKMRRLVKLEPRKANG